MSDNYQCWWCERTDERVQKITAWRRDWRGNFVVTCVFHAHKDCFAKETSTSGDGHGVGVNTA